jgi:hypothetical protein
MIMKMNYQKKNIYVNKEVLYDEKSFSKEYLLFSLL